MKHLILFLLVGTMLTSCYKTQGPEYLDEQDITITAYDVNFDFTKTKTVVINDTVALRHDYLTDDQVKEFYKRNGTSWQIIDEITHQFESKGYLVKISNTTDTIFLNSADLYVNPVMMLSQTTEVVYWPGYGWGGYYPGWGWGWGYSGYYSVGPQNNINTANANLTTEKNADYYDYGYGSYYPGWGWGGGGYSQYEYETGTLTMEMAEGKSVRDYWNWFATHTPEEIRNYPDSVPELKMVWKAFIEGQVSGDTKYDDQRGERGFDEAFEQSFYLNK